MICNRCGTPINSTDKNCPNCGMEVNKTNYDVVKEYNERMYEKGKDRSNLSLTVLIIFGTILSVIFVLILYKDLGLKVLAIPLFIGFCIAVTYIRERIRKKAFKSVVDLGNTIINKPKDDNK